ncbi:MAG: hypothetical protein KC476_11195, partial [Cyanobacteria bacterium HKST-UBA06]|nr:hypothetical protein [Cyanobacteria bacterium HKST-UBA06]
MRVGYLGPTGTHSHVAAKQFKQMLRQHNTADSVALFPMATFTQLLHDVEAQAIELACVPIENALEGSVNEVIDNLALYRDELAIVGDFVIPIRHALIRTVSARDGIQFIHSHPHVWNQCRQTIYDLLGHDVTYISTSSSAEAIRALNAQDASHAALGTLEAAEHHGLDIVMEDCSAHNKNATRFLLIAHKDTNPLADWAIDTLPRKTSYCFAFREDEAGILIKGLK